MLKIESDDIVAAVRKKNLLEGRGKVLEFLFLDKYLKNGAPGAQGG